MVLWLLAEAVPDLSLYRKLGLLWTKVTGRVLDRDGTPITGPNGTYPDPVSPARSHCIALATPIYFSSYEGKVQRTGTIYQDGAAIRCPLSVWAEEINLLSDSPIHRLRTDPFAQVRTVIPTLRKKGYVKEKPVETTWEAVLADVGRICHGIAMRFHQPTEEEQTDLAHEAFVQVITKLAQKKLVYTPGRAPVFNLLTTTVYRCMYSIMNSRNNRKTRFKKLAAEVQIGTAPHGLRSLRLH